MSVCVSYVTRSRIRFRFHHPSNSKSMDINPTESITSEMFQIDFVSPVWKLP